MIFSGLRLGAEEVKRVEAASPKSYDPVSFAVSSMGPERCSTTCLDV